MYRVLTPGGPQWRKLGKGAYKTEPNHAFNSEGELAGGYAPVLAVADEMHRLVEELRSEPFASATAVHQAAYVHHALTRIHPFPDGNGRVARALASVFLIRASGTPLLVFNDEKEDYFTALSTADQGDPESFVGIIAGSSQSAMRLVTDYLRVASLTPPEATVERLSGLYVTSSGFSVEELDQASETLMVAARQKISQRIGELGLPAQVRANVSTGTPGAIQISDSTQYRMPIVNNTHIILTLDTIAPANAGVAFNVIRAISKASGNPDPEIRLEPSDFGEVFSAKASSVFPEVSARVDLELDPWAEVIVANALETLLQRAEQQLRNAGY